MELSPAKRVSDVAVDVIFLKRLFSICRQALRTRLSLFLVASLFLSTTTQTLVVSFTGGVIASFYSAIASADGSAFSSALVLGASVTLGSALLFCLCRVLTELLAWSWRGSLVSSIHERYFSGHACYALCHLDDRVDNPDQRITADVDNLTATMSLVLQQCISAPFVVACYATITAVRVAWYVPLVVFGFFLVGSLVGRVAAKPGARAAFDQERLEGEFRTLHGWVRSMSESIALSDGERHELESARRSFAELLRNKRRLVLCHFGLNTTTQLFTYLGTVLNYCVVAMPVFLPFSSTRRRLSYPEITADCFYCLMLVSGLSTFFNCGTLISDLAGYTSRVHTLLEVCREVSECPSPAGKEDPTEDCERGYQESSVPRQCAAFGDCVEFKGVTYFTPDGARCLVRDLSFRVERGTRLLITGRSGGGKSSLLRVLYGLWPCWTGKICKPRCSDPSSIIYLPQRPYLAYGCTLDQQIRYPLVDGHVLADSELRSLLQSVGLQHLAHERSRVDWASFLSQGEEQRLVLLRVLYHRPAFVALDEATCALDSEMESRVYGLLHNAGIAILSVGHSPSLRSFHNTELHLDGSGGWSLQTLPVA